MNRPLLSFTLLLVCHLLSGISVANSAFLTEDDLLDSRPTLASATRLEQRIGDIPAAVTLIDRRMIQASGAVNIADLLRLVPGFQVYHVNANVFGVTSHGQGENHNSRLEVMVDGRSVYLPLLSTVDWSALGIGIDDIDRIEVVRGPNVSTQGSNAFLGAINIVTRNALQDQGSQIGSTVGSLDTREYYLRHNGQAGALNYRFSANYHRNSGTGVGYDNGFTTNPPEVIPDGGDISQLLWSGIYTPNLTDSLDIQLGYSRGQIGVGSSPHPSEFNPRDVDSHFQSLRWSRNLSHNESLKISASRNYHKWRETDLLSVPADALFGGQPAFTIDLGVEDGVTQRYDLEIEHYTAPLDTIRLIKGIGLRWESLQSDALLASGRTEEALYRRVFANVEWRPSVLWTFNAGAMLEASKLVSPRVSPRLGVNYHITPKQTVRAAVSRAYRTPSLLEENLFAAITLPISGGILFDLNSFTSGDLDPEKVTNYELGYLIQNPTLDSTFDFKLFIEDVEDGISGVRVPYTTPNSSFTTDNQNVQHWKTRGGEAQWKLQPWDHTWFYLAYANTRASGNQPRGVGRADIDPSDHNPRSTLALMANHHFGYNLDGSLIFYRMSDVEWLGGDALDDYNRLDLRLAKGFQTQHTDGSIELVVQNLLTPYVEFERNNNFDTRTFIRFTLNFL